MRTNLRTNGVLLSQTKLLLRIAWRGRRDLNPRLLSNISNLTSIPVRTIAYKLRTNRKESMGEYNWKVPDCEELVGVNRRRLRGWFFFLWSFAAIVSGTIILKI